MSVAKRVADEMDGACPAEALSSIYLRFETKFPWASKSDIPFVLRT
jgi:hypothetical protein